MSDHLPECPQIFGKPDWYCCEDCDPGVWDDCICDRLRVCEQRVRDEDQRILIKHGAEQFVRGEQIGKAMGYAAGLNTARDAVAALNWEDVGPLLREPVLAAIDALKEKP